MQNPLFNDILTNYFTGPAHLKKLKRLLAMSDLETKKEKKMKGTWRGSKYLVKWCHWLRLYGKPRMRLKPNKLNLWDINIPRKFTYLIPPCGIFKFTYIVT